MKRHIYRPGWYRLGVALVLLVAVAGCSKKSVVRGTLVAPDPSEVRGGIPVDGSDEALFSPSLREAIVFAIPTGETSSPESNSKMKSRIEQTSAGFEPTVLPIPVGSSVEFANHDTVFHNAFSLSKANGFDLESFGPGSKKIVKFDRVGVVPIFCELHPQSVGFVVVMPDATYSRASHEGAFQLPDLPRGKYTIKAWHPLFGETSSRVDLTGKKEIDLTLAF